MTGTHHPPCLPGTGPQRLAASPDRERLYAEFQPLVHRLLRKYGNHPDLRQDLVGEIYSRFCTLLAAYDPDRGVPLRPYLVRSLTASVYSYARRQWRLQRCEMLLEAEQELEAASEPSDPTDRWLRALLTREILNQLPAMIAALPRRQRQVVIWRYYEDRSFDEIAAMLRVTPATARSLLRHGLNHLRHRIAPGDGEGQE